MTGPGFDALLVGDEVWCLAAVGVPYEVTNVDREQGRVGARATSGVQCSSAVRADGGHVMDAHQGALGPDLVLARPGG